MQYRELGETGIKVSAICLGTMTWGEQNSEEEAHAQMDYALEQGVNFFDTAELYPVPPRKETYGLTEQYIGSWFKARQNRDKIILASKAAGPESALSYMRGGPQLNGKQIHSALEESLRRLQTDYIDLYQLHWPARTANYFGQLGYVPKAKTDPPPPSIKESLAALQELVQAGKVRYAGISNETPWGMMQYLIKAEKGLPRIVSIQNPYNLLNRTFEIGLAEVADRERVGLLAYSPLAFGVLSGKYLNGARPQGARLSLYRRFGRYTHEQAEEATKSYVQLAKKHSLDAAQMALAFINRQPFVTANIIGATSLEQLRSNIASIDVQLSAPLLEEIEKIHNHNSNPCP